MSIAAESFSLVHAAPRSVARAPVDNISERVARALLEHAYSSYIGRYLDELRSDPMHGLGAIEYVDVCIDGLRIDVRAELGDYRPSTLWHSIATVLSCGLAQIELVQRPRRLTLNSVTSQTGSLPSGAQLDAVRSGVALANTRL